MLKTIFRMTLALWALILTLTTVWRTVAAFEPRAVPQPAPGIMLPFLVLVIGLAAAPVGALLYAIVSRWTSGGGDDGGTEPGDLVLKRNPASP